jgi:hypothetical protein
MVYFCRHELEKFLGKSGQLGIVAFQASLFFDQSCVALVLLAVRLIMVFFFIQSHTNFWRT